MRRDQGAKFAWNPASTRLLESGRQMHKVIRTSSSHFVVDAVAAKIVASISELYVDTSVLVGVEDRVGFVQKLVRAIVI